MGTIDRSQVIVPVLPFEIVNVPEAGGDVRVQGLLLGERSAMLAAARALAEDVDFVPAVLERTVRLDDGQPLYDLAAWRVFAAMHVDRVNQLFAVALRLNGADPEQSAKN